MNWRCIEFLTTNYNLTLNNFMNFFKVPNLADTQTILPLRVYHVNDCTVAFSFKEDGERSGFYFGTVYIIGDDSKSENLIKYVSEKSILTIVKGSKLIFKEGKYSR